MSVRSKAIQARTSHIMTRVDAHAEATRRSTQLRCDADAAAEAGDSLKAASLLREADEWAGKAARAHQLVRANIIESLTAASEGRL